MEHISQLTAESRDKAAYPDILVISRIFLPKEAVIGEYIYNRCLQDPELVAQEIKYLIKVNSFPCIAGFTLDTGVVALWEVS